MGSDLYLSIDVRRPPSEHWYKLFGGPSVDLARGIVVSAFGSFDDRRAGGEGYLTRTELTTMEAFSDTPWIDAEPYWVRRLSGSHFCDIVREKRWQRIQKAPDGTYDFSDTECSPELRAFAALVRSLLDDGLDVRVSCWHSQ